MPDPKSEPRPVISPASAPGSSPAALTTASADAPRDYDVFNGDADGLCALAQWRLARPARTIKVTGLKRDIELVARVPARAGDRITVLDISLERNREGVERALAAGASIRYFDHHHAGVIPDHPRFDAHIDTSADVCTSILVDAYLQGAHRLWAVAAAFGDGLARSASRLAASCSLEEGDLDRLRELGEAINHNAYGESLDDVLIAAERLFDVMLRYPDPREMARDEPIAHAMIERMRDDLSRAAAIEPVRDVAEGAVYVLPDVGWSRRVVGSFANLVAQRDPSRSSVVAICNERGESRISVRAGTAAKTGADELCRGFGGNGRAKAAGIDRLPAEAWDDFLARFAGW